MKILMLTKRRYTGRDLIDDRYGRLWELPAGFATLGHSVHGLVLAYTRRRDADRPPFQDPPGVRWTCRATGRLRPRGFMRYVAEAVEIARAERPDVVLACSDPLYVVAGRKVAQAAGAALVVDLYDNFESFASARLPLVLRLFREAVRDADGVICVSTPLAEKVRTDYGREGPVAVVENAVRRDRFRPRDTMLCRHALGLPADGHLVGTAGALSATRDIGVLFEAFMRLAAEDPTVHLVLAGPRDVPLPTHDRVIDLGNLPPDRVPEVLNALDVSVVCNTPSAFGDYCFPQKVYEILGCGVPVVAADMGSMGRLLRDHPECLFDPGDPAHLKRQIAAQLAQPRVPPLAVPDWDQLAARAAAFLESVRQAHPAAGASPPLARLSRSGEGPHPWPTP